MGQDDGTTIYLLRHGESHANVRSVLSNGNAYDAGLTERGPAPISRGGRLAARGQPLAALYTSPPAALRRDGRHSERGTRLRGYGLRGRAGD